MQPVLAELHDLGERIQAKNFTKYQSLLERLKGIGLDDKKCEERVVVFQSQIVAEPVKTARHVVAAVTSSPRRAPW